MKVSCISIATIAVSYVKFFVMNCVWDIPAVEKNCVKLGAITKMI